MDRNLQTAISLINRTVYEINISNQVYTPDLANEIFYLRGQSLRYGKLGEDGVHPTEKVKEVWANKLAKTMKKNMDNMPFAPLPSEQAQQPSSDSEDEDDINPKRDWKY